MMTFCSIKARMVRLDGVRTQTRPDVKLLYRFQVMCAMPLIV
jgi:hypothetical protein